MSYFLKKTKTKKGIYYQVYNGVHDPEKGYTTQKSVKVIGYHENLLKDGIEDPLTYAKNMVAEMEKARKDELENKNKQKITGVSPIKKIGYLLPIAVMNKLDIKEHIYY